MNKKLYAIIIGLVLIIGYQGGYLDKLFSKKSIDCDSKEALELGKSIIKEKLFSRIFSNTEYKIDEIEFDTIVTKNINKDTGSQECRAITNILGNFSINKNENFETYLFNTLFENVINLGNNDFLVTSHVWYTTEVTNDNKYLVNLKFDTDQTKIAYDKKISPNDEETFNLMLPFAKKGNAKLQNKIGVMYSSGKGVKKDTKEAFKWFEKSANQGFNWAQFNLADMYYNGTGIEKNLQKAFELFSKASEQGNYMAQNRLANMYYAGQATQQDYKKALYWYEKSVNQGFDWAQFNLADMYYNGTGTEKNLQKAFELFSKSSEQGNYKAKYFLAEMYIKGEAVPIDIPTAKVLLEIAESNGYKNEVEEIRKKYNL